MLLYQNSSDDHNQNHLTSQKIASFAVSKPIVMVDGGDMMYLLSGHQFLKTLLEVFAKYGMMSGVRK